MMNNPFILKVLENIYIYIFYLNGTEFYLNGTEFVLLVVRELRVR